MKRLYAILILCIAAYACGGSSSGSGSGSSSVKCADGTVKCLKGVAAKGKVLAKGCPVQVRGAAVDGVPSKVIESVVADDQGNYAVDVSELTPPYLVRVFDKDNFYGWSGWYHSYAQDTLSNANVNPLTSKMITDWYGYSYGTNLTTTILDSVFESGVYPDGALLYNYGGSSTDIIPSGTPIPMPDMEDIKNITALMNYWLSNTYISAGSGVALDDPITGLWKVGEGYDSILDDILGEGANLHNIAWITIGYYEWKEKMRKASGAVRVYAFHVYCNPDTNILSFRVYTNGEIVSPTPGGGTPVLKESMTDGYKCNYYEWTEPVTADSLSSNYWNPDEFTADITFEVNGLVYVYYMPMISKPFTGSLLFDNTKE